MQILSSVTCAPRRLQGVSTRTRRHAPRRISAAYQSNEPQGSTFRRPLEERLSDPLEILALPGRVALGTLLRLPEALANPSAVQERLQSILSDSRPVQEIGAALAGELQTSLLESADRGTEAEAQLRSALPAPVADLLPPLPATPGANFDASNAQIDVTPGATRGTTFSPGPPREMPAERFSGGQAANRLGSELSRLSAEVESVREAVTEYAAMSVKEQRDRLLAHLREIDAAGVDGKEDLLDVIEEVRLLSAELEALKL